MSSRKLLLMGVAGIGVIALLADRTFLNKAEAGIADLGNMVQEVKKAQAIAASLDDGGPAALQTLLDALAEDHGVTPGQADAGLFGTLASLTAPPTADAGFAEGVFDPPPTVAGGSVVSPETTGSTPAPTHRVTMVMTGARGGMALIDGRPMTMGESQDGLTLLAVREDGVSVRELGETRFIALSDASQ